MELVKIQLKEAEIIEAIEAREEAKKTLLIGQVITVLPKGLKETTKATITGFKTLPSGKELIIIVTEDGLRFPITLNEIVKKVAKKPKVSGRIEASKSEITDMWGDVEKRYLTFYTQLTSKDLKIEELQELFYKVADYMRKQHGLSFCGCPYDLGDEKTAIFGDAIEVEYFHGDMKEAKTEIMEAWKDTKKHFKIR